MKKGLLKNIEEYKGLKSPIWLAYIILCLPFFAIIFSILSSISGIGHTELSSLSGQYILFFPLCVCLFLCIDLYRLILKERQFDSIKSTFKNYPELFIFAGFLLCITLASVLQTIFLDTSTAWIAKIKHLFVHEGIPFFYFYALCLLCGFFIKDRSIANHLLVFFMVISAFLGLLVFIDPTGQFVFHEICNTNWAGVFINSNHYGYFLLLSTLVAATSFALTDKKSLKIISLILLIEFLILLMFNDTLGCLLACFIALILLPIVIGIRERKFCIKSAIPLALFIIISVIASFIASYYHSTYTLFFGQFANLFSETSTIIKDPTGSASMSAGTDRWERWLDAIDQIVSSPIIGTGDVLLRPHNEYLQYAASFGLPALLIYVSAYVVMFVKAIKNIKKLSYTTLVCLFAIGGYLISAFFGVTMPHVLPFMTLILGLAIRWLNKDILSQKS